jgi:hypothetical protein
MATGEVAVVRAGEASVVEDDLVVVEEEDGSKMTDLPAKYSTAHFLIIYLCVAP